MTEPVEVIMGLGPDHAFAARRLPTHEALA
jgi:hypothetical protein